MRKYVFNIDVILLIELKFNNQSNNNVAKIVYFAEIYKGLVIKG